MPEKGLEPPDVYLESIAWEEMLTILWSVSGMFGHGLVGILVNIPASRHLSASNTILIRA
jgi:hypothetical protein